MRTLPGNRRLHVAAAAAAAVVVLLAAVLLVRSCGGDAPPATGAVRFVPQDALVYVHVSTDGGRGAVKRATDVLGRFNGYERERDTILARLAGTGTKVDAGRDVAPWLGDDAALALVDAGQATAGSLVVIAVRDAGKARRFLERNPTRSAQRTYKGDRLDEYGDVVTAIKDGYLLIGQSATVTAALDRVNGRGKALDSNPTFADATAHLPAGRVADAYLSADGLRRLLAPQGGVLGALAVVLDQPALRGVGVSLEASEHGAKVVTHSILDPAQAKRSGRAFKPFEPQLESAVPADSLAYLGVTGINGALSRLLTAAAGGANAGGVGPLLERLRSELSKQTGGSLERDLLGLFDGEVALVVTKATPAPFLSLVTKVGDEARTRDVLRRLQAPLAQLLTPKGEQAPTWRTEDAGGTRAATLTTPSGAALSYAVFDGRLVLSTSVDGIRRIKDHNGSLSDSQAAKDVAGDHPAKVTSLGFLDFNQLLELGEQTGLNESKAYLAVRDDLHKIRAAGVSSHGGDNETTAEIRLSIP